LPNENSQETISTVAVHHRRMPFVAKVLFALVAVGLAVALLITQGEPFLKTAWQPVGPVASPAEPSPKVALNRAATSSPESTPTANLVAASSGTPDEQAERIWAEFEKTTWDAPLQTWSGQHQEIPCKAFRGTMWGVEADRQWSHRCAAGEQLESPHWSFYVFGLQEPLTPRLEQFDESSATLPEEALKTLQSTLQGRLAARFGPGEDRSQKPLSAHAFWWPQMHWQNGDVEIQLFASEFDPQRREGRLRLLAQHRTLLEALKEDSRLSLVGGRSTLWYNDVGSAIDKQLADQLNPEFPTVAVMLIKQQPDPDPQKVREALEQFQKQLRAQASQGGQQMGVRAAVIAMPQTNWKAEEYYGALVKLLTSVKTAAPARKPVLLLAADRMASRLPGVVADDKTQVENWAEWRARLEEFGVTYDGSEASSNVNGWLYTGALLKRVWTDYAETEWGERAFLVMQQQGWDTSEYCSGGTDQFRIVIQRGLEFQQKHPNSAFLPEVELTVAQAYETWWSLSQAPTGEELREEEVDVQPANYRNGAEDARRKALAAYEHLLQSAPNSDEAVYARRVLPRLKLGIDTGQRRFYCSYDD